MPQDALQIDDLPPEVEGIPIRETIREVFRDPANGKPDDINQRGCLELALISNQLGGEDKGHLVWNAWREAFPVVINSPDHITKNGSIFYRKRPFFNNVDFSGIDFEDSSFDDFSYLVFPRFQFGCHANFSKIRKDSVDFQLAVFGNKVNFQSAQFGENANFRGARWGAEANFKGAVWGECANFQGASWEENATFVGAQWGDCANFTGAQWRYGARFIGAQWGKLAFFECASWGDSAKFKGAQFDEGAVFDRAHFDRFLDFRGCTLDQLRADLGDDNLLENLSHWANSRGLTPNEFFDISFRRSTFGEVDFSNRKFNGNTNFGMLHPNDKFETIQRDANGAAVFDAESLVTCLAKEPRRHTIFGAAPKFHGCELHQDTSFEGAVFPPATGSEDAARAYQTLKLAFSKQQNIRAEQRFFRLEMEEETLRETGLKRWLFNAYKKCSDFGFSISLPLKFWCVCVLFITAVYGLLSWFGQCGLAVQDCRFALQWLEFSLAQTLPLPGFEKLSDAARKEFWPAGAEWSFALSLLVIAHKTISLAFLFLIGLALRNLFKLK